MKGPNKALRARLKSLETHLREENPLLVEAMGGFRNLSRVGYSMGLLKPDESYATQISWWPLISVLGTFSAGKSTFINQYLQNPLQDTGNQAVDDKFTVICYGSERESRVLPGLALDADPRFPFYQTSEELEKVAPGEGRRIDAYLQLKTCNSPLLSGRIFIDSPGFDADAQRSATLRLTNHIITLSDLCLVMFDARHPEPGAMSDTLAHLVKDTIDRSDSSKFMYILNQIDTTAREDNPEKVVGSWQRALAREGLTAGRFYTIYNPDASVPIEDAALRRRFAWKREQDMDEITRRIDQVSIERCYRVVGTLEKRAQEIEEHYVPRLQGLIKRWRNKVLSVEAFVLAVAGLVVGGLWFSKVQMPAWLVKLWDMAVATPQSQLIAAGIVTVILFYLHFTVRKFTAKHIINEIEATESPVEAERLAHAFKRNTHFTRSIFEVYPAGWTRWNRKRLKKIVADADRYVQALNDRFTDPSAKHPPAADSDKKSQNNKKDGESDGLPEAVSGEVMPRST